MSDRNHDDAEVLADGLRDALQSVFVSPNVADGNGEPANLVDVVDRLARTTARVANAIMPADALPGKDDHGNVVASLTEAVMSVGTSLDGVAHAADGHGSAVANAVEAHGKAVAKALNNVARALGNIAEMLGGLGEALGGPK